jgi:hypothetical protein
MKEKYLAGLAFKWEDNIKTDVIKIGCDVVDRI